MNLLLWVICFGVCCVVVYGPYTDEGDHVFTNLDSSMYEALARTGWGLAVAWVIFACSTGNGGKSLYVLICINVNNSRPYSY